MASTNMQLHITRYKAVTKTTANPIVLLHGWGFDSGSWQPLLLGLQEVADVWAVDLPGFGQSAHLTQFNVDEIVTALARQLPERSCLMGWSLGGMLATKFAIKFPGRVSQLITLASNLCFVEKEFWPWAMPLKINQAFNQQFADAPELTLKNFYGLISQGSEKERALNKGFRRNQAVNTINNAWHQALASLSAQDNYADFSKLVMPGLHLFAEKDALVPVQAADKITKLNATQKTQIIAGVCHALHWDNAAAVLAEITQFITKKEMHPCQRNKQLVARSFSRAATSYDSVAYLQRDVGKNLCQNFLHGNAAQSATVLDLGVGTGYLLGDLKNHYLDAQIVALDLAEGMLKVARQKHDKAAAWVCGDAEFLPFSDKSFNFIFSNLALQWCENLPLLFTELYRVLKPGGRLIFSTLSQGTLRELSEAWQSVNRYVHVNQFPEVASIQQAIQSAGFNLAAIKTQSYPLYYQDFLTLARELKALGAHNVNAGRPEGLTTQAQLKQLIAAYEKNRTAEGLSLTYEVVYLDVSRGEHD